jgi:hypothetical protein
MAGLVVLVWKVEAEDLNWVSVLEPKVGNG